MPAYYTVSFRAVCGLNKFWLGSKLGTCDHYWLVAKTWKKHIKGMLFEDMRASFGEKIRITLEPF